MSKRHIKDLFFLWIGLGLLSLGCQSAEQIERVSNPPPQDTSSTWKREYYNEITLDNFRSYKPFLQLIDFKNIDYPRLNAAIFFATNEIRRDNKLSLLKYAPELECAAWNHAKRMVENNFFSHTDNTDKLRRTPFDRGLLAGIKNPHIAENIAENFASNYDGVKKLYPLNKKGEFSYNYNGKPIPPHTYLSFADDVLKIWMNSSGHSANILSKNALQLGCGAYFFYDTSNLNFPKFRVVQNYQWYNEIEKTKALDLLP